MGRVCQQLGGGASYRTSEVNCKLHIVDGTGPFRLVIRTRCYVIGFASMMATSRVLRLLVIGASVNVSDLELITIPSGSQCSSTCQSATFTMTVSR